MAEELENVIAHSLECPICLTYFTDPKILSCDHTYCKACLEVLLEYHGDDQPIRCPLCKVETKVPNQDVSKLPINLALRNLIEDMKKQQQLCTNCKSDDNPRAVVYCQDCGKYLCTSCHSMHSMWGDFISHEVTAMSEISSGNVSVRRYRKCIKHPKEDEECFCCNCKKFACFRCVVVEHKDEGHQIIKAAEYEKSHMKMMNDLKSKVHMKCSLFKKYVDMIDEQKERVTNAQKECTDDINKAYDEWLQQLNEKKELLVCEVKNKSDGVSGELEELKNSAESHIMQLTTIADMITNRARAPLDSDTLAVHNTLCEDLHEALNHEDPDYEQARKSSKKGKGVSLYRFVVKDNPFLGKIVEVVSKNTMLPTKNSMNAMTCTPDGSMLVGCHTGGEIYCTDGHLQKSVLKDVDIHGVGFLSDNRCVVIDGSNNIMVYTPEYTQLNVTFETLSKDEGGFANLTVDGDNQIYVSYRKAKKIQVFSAVGGKADREIAYSGYEVQQITCHNDLLLTVNFISTRSIDKDGVVKHRLRKPGCNLYPAVSLGNKILIAEVKHDIGLVNIDEYTDELKHTRNLIKDHTIEKPDRAWYYLKQYHSGDVAFCTPDKLYIFH